MATRNSPISGPSGYVLVPLREGAEFTLYRGRKHDDPSPVLAIALSTEQPSPQSISSNTNTRSQPNLIPGGRPSLWPLLVTSQRMEIGQLLRLFVALSGAIGQLHGLGLIHKDRRT